MHDEQPATKHPNATKVWIEDGVLYSKFSGELSLETILDAQKQTLELLKQNKINVIPTIIDITEMDEASMKLHLSDLGKIFMSANDVTKHESGIWIVGTKESGRKLSSIVSKLFLNNRLQQAENMAVAQAAAKASIGQSDPILEQGN